ncbi:SIR2-domain-containing protein [Lentinula raphanica]|uniref:SIR2-domain-containing protein n=1 Tax=Lentinula raphanica TaxID=153919 RepID=A0AA38P6C4_9AGAR|nr:SIR2-domain-containing protein [Lentinula raphanica]KAJ3973121.1 SIR2-domain-containing protein [Lentinula raphanica]
MDSGSSHNILNSHEFNPSLTSIPPLSESNNASPSNLLLLQVKAFLQAAEDVEVGTETIQELLQLLTDTQTTKVELEPTRDAQDDEDEEWLPADDLNDMELDISALYTGVPNETWTKEERKEMIGFLKERGMGHFVRKYAITRAIPIPKLLSAFGIELCPELQNRSNSTLYYFLRVAMWKELRLRERLPQYNTISDAVNLIRNSKRILILTGAGISVSCGIPDFRSRNGLYAQLGNYELDDPQQMFDINYFRENPSVFYSFASQIYPSNFVPSPCHRFIKLIEDKGQLLRNYTQNIDTLETVAGVERVLQCHGSFATASCLHCRRRVPGTEIESDIMRRKVPLCPVCNPPSSSTPKPGKKMSKKKAKGEWDSECEDESDGASYPPGIMKPDITFFGEKLTDDFEHSLEEDRDNVDLLLVIGTSLKVAPVADILSHLPHSIPQILINKTPIRHINPDIILLGNADDIVIHLCAELGWDLPPITQPSSSSPSPFAGRMQPPRGNLKKRPSSGLDGHQEEGSVIPKRVGTSHVWLFSGAEGGKWLSEFETRYASDPEGVNSAETSPPSSTTQTRASTPGTADLRREVKKARIS